MRIQSGACFDGTEFSGFINTHPRVNGAWELKWIFSFSPPNGLIFRSTQHNKHKGFWPQVQVFLYKIRTAATILRRAVHFIERALLSERRYKKSSRASAISIAVVGLSARSLLSKLLF
jgi:hypothetical protein